MQKKIIALAIAGLASSAAFAQSNVTVYGVVDVGQAFVHSSGLAASQNNVGRLDSNSSYLGVKGVEDLGNGLKALFQYESGFTTDTGGALAGGRDSFIGLTGGFGTAVAGNLTHPLRAFGLKAELVAGQAGFGTTSSVTGTILGVKTGADDRAANALAYVSPNFGGFTGTVAYVNGETKNNVGTVSGAGTTASPYTGNVGHVNSRQWQIAGQYENGPLFVGLGLHKAKSLALTAALDQLGPVAISSYNEEGQDARVIRAVAVYTLPTNTKLTALYDATKVETGTTGAAVLGFDVAKRNAWSLGVAQGFGRNTVGLEYGHSNKVKLDGASIDQTQSHILTAVYSYELSKRTVVHARASKLSNGDSVNNAFYNNPVNNGVAGSFGSDYTGYMVGLRHNF